MEEITTERNPTPNVNIPSSENVSGLSENRIISGFWRRLFASVIDGIVLGITGIILGLFLYNFLASIGFYGRLIGFSIALIYFGILNSSIAGGQTLGKKILKIEVVQRDGTHIGLLRSLLRYVVLGSPYFLNQIILPPSTPVIFVYLALFIIFGIGGAIIYLYTFNRRTRQSLHDLIVGTYVVKTETDGRVESLPVWTPHFVVLGIYLSINIFVLLIPLLSGSNVNIAANEIVSNTKYANDINSVSCVSGTQWSIVNGNKSTTTYYDITVIWKTKPENYEKSAADIASAAISQYPDIMDNDILAIHLTHGYDIGIASAWTHRNFVHSPAEWQEIANGQTTNAQEE